MSQHRADGYGTEDLDNHIRNVMREEFDHYLADIEFRLKQIYDVANRPQVAETAPQIQTEHGQLEAEPEVVYGNHIYAEDIHDNVHRITGYTVTSNSPGAGSIAWSSVHVVYNGVDYTITDANTANMYIYFVKPGSGTSATFQTSNTKPSLTTLGDGGALIFVNNAGTPVSVLQTGSLPSVLNDGAVTQSTIVNGAVGSNQIANGAVTNTQLGALSVGSGNLQANSVISGKVATGAVSAPNLNVFEHLLY